MELGTVTPVEPSEPGVVVDTISERDKLYKALEQILECGVIPCLQSLFTTSSTLVLMASLGHISRPLSVSHYGIRATRMNRIIYEAFHVS